MEHIQVELSPFQRANLAILATFLETDPRVEEQFSMRYYQHPVNLDAERDHDMHEVPECFTVACAVGWGPIAIPKSIKPEDEDNFNRYANRMFGASNRMYGLGGDVFFWLFHYDWEGVDNTPKGAAARIRYFLSNGIPVNYMKQLYEGEQLCYKVPA